MALARIIGSAESEFKTIQEDLNVEEMVYHTVRKALENAGLGIEDIETVVQGGDDVLDGININHVYTVEPAGSFLKEESKIEEDGAFALFYALARMMTGKFKTAMVVSFGKTSESRAELNGKFKPYTDPEISGEWYYFTQFDPFYMRPLRHDVGTYHAIQYNAYLAGSGLTEEDVAAVTAKTKKAGLKNPNAPHAKDVSVEDIMQSGYVATPLKKLEVPLNTDGVSVLIIAQDDFAEKKGYAGTRITGIGSASDAYYPGYRKLEGAPTAAISAEKAFAMAGKSPKDVDLAEIYSLFSYQEPMLYQELFGWSADEIKSRIKNGDTAEGGELPVNLSGGALCAHPIMATGLSRIIHTDRLLQSQKLKTGLAHAQSGMGLQSNIVYILEN